MKSNLFIFMAFATILFFNAIKCMTPQLYQEGTNILDGLPNNPITTVTFNDMKNFHSRISKIDSAAASRFLNMTIKALRDHVNDAQYESLKIKEKIHKWIGQKIVRRQKFSPISEPL